MMEIRLTEQRREILTAASSHNGVAEDRWAYNRSGELALRYLVKQQCLDRRISDGKSRFLHKLYITERGRKLLAGEMVNELEEKASGSPSNPGGAHEVKQAS